MQAPTACRCMTDPYAAVDSLFTEHGGDLAVLRDGGKNRGIQAYMEERVMAADITPGEVLRDKIPIVAIDLPVMYEDEGQDEMGQTDLHFESVAILRYGLRAHLPSRPQYRVFSVFEQLATGCSCPRRGES